VANLPGHVVFWVVCALIAIVALGRAWNMSSGGDDGMDDQYRITNFWKYQKTKFWAGIGIVALVVPFIDAMFFFTPPPPSLR
jgi:hypothetical protein